jgi:hypothetical protein
MMVIMIAESVFITVRRGWVAEDQITKLRIIQA